MKEYLEVFFNMKIEKIEKKENNFIINNKNISKSFIDKILNEKLENKYSEKEKKIFIFFDDIIYDFFTTSYYIERIKFLNKYDFLPIILLSNINSNSKNFINLLKKENLNFKIDYILINENYLNLLNNLKIKNNCNKILYSNKIKNLEKNFKDYYYLIFYNNKTEFTDITKYSKNIKSFNDFEINYLEYLKYLNINVLNIDIEKNIFNFKKIKINQENNKEYIFIKNKTNKIEEIKEICEILDYELINNSLEEDILIIDKIEDFKENKINFTFNKNIVNENIKLLTDDLFENLELFLDLDLNFKEKIKNYDFLDLIQ